MRIITVKMPDIYVEGLDELVRAGRYSSRSEAIRVAVRELLKRELWAAGIPATAHYEAGVEAPRGVGLLGLEGPEVHH